MAGVLLGRHCNRRILFDFRFIDVAIIPIAHFKEGAERGHEFAVRGLAMMERILEKRDALGF